MATDPQRHHLHALMAWLLDHEPAIHYAQVRPMRTTHLREQQLADLFHAGHSITMDCSESVTLLCRLAGLADPNGRGYDGAGYTGTLLAHLPHYSDARRAQVGALIVYGPDDGDHVVMVMDPGADPWVFSHGAEGGPRRVRHSTERAVHREPARLLNIARL